ncbi:MAG: SPASM domain-containing protein, partial [Candidatus Omnitrophica bacterium]|nr:SPASM domain-containing protein [Candidatus Omnitrophota bacterium]
EFADQITFVKYNPWENVYRADLSDTDIPCSDLWRRMFIWYDGKINPCDTDYKSSLSVGNIEKNDIRSIWRGKKYEALRLKHLKEERKTQHPCNRCVVI